MSNYTKSTNFATKDNLTPGDPLKIVRGTEIDTEYNNIATAIATKTDNASAAITGGTINDTTIGATTPDTGAFTTLAASGTTTLSGLTASTALALDSSKNVVSVTNTGSGNNVLATSPTLVTPALGTPSALVGTNITGTATSFNINGTVGATTPTTGAFTTLSASGAVTLSGGTVNGVAYLNGSKVVTSGSALTFDGTNLATTGDISLGAGKLLKYSSTAYITPENNVSGAEISTTGVITFLTGSGTPTERARIDSSGNLGIGTSSPSYKLHVSSGATAATSYFTSTATPAYSATAYNGGSARIALNGGGASGATTGINFSQGSSFELYLGGVEESGGAAAFVFQGYNGSAYTERARIDSSGNLFVNSTTISNSPARGVQLWSGSSNSIGGIAIGHDTGVASGNYFATFNYASGMIGSITQSGTTAVLYNTTSDQRLKENIVDAPEFGSVIDSIKVRSFDWKTSQEHQRAGFVAQELVTVAPEAVHQPEDTEQMMAVDYSKLVPMLVKEIQSLRKRLADAGI